MYITNEDELRLRRYNYLQQECLEIETNYYVRIRKLINDAQSAQQNHKLYHSFNLGESKLLAI